MSRREREAGVRVGSSDTLPAVVELPPVRRAQQRSYPGGREEAPVVNPIKGQAFQIWCGTAYGDDRAGLFIPEPRHALLHGPILSAMVRPGRSLTLLFAVAGLGLSLWSGIVRFPDLASLLATGLATVVLAASAGAGDSRLIPGHVPTNRLIGVLVALGLGLFFRISLQAVVVVVLWVLTSIVLSNLVRCRQEATASDVTWPVTVVPSDSGERSNR